MLKILLAVSSPAMLLAQIYSLSFYGLPIGTVTLETAPDMIRFSTHSVGITEYIWPFENEYQVTFVSGTYTIDEYTKTIRQGATDFHLTCSRKEGGIYTWTGGDTLHRPQGMENIFTLLARVQNLSVPDIDTRWYNLDHKGERVRARFLWADSVWVRALSDSILCDHYRLDMIPEATTDNQQEQQDYFIKYISEESLIRQLWVEREKPHRIIKAQVSRGPLKVEALIEDE